MVKGKASIMIVEDEAIVAKEIKASLEDLGYTVTSAVNTGEAALEKAEQNRPDLILMDIRLDGPMDGVETAGQIQSRFNIPVVYLTAFADEKVLERVKITEPFGYIIKPYQDRELHSAVEIALHTHTIKNKLLESEKRYRDLVENINDIVYSLDENKAITYISPAAEWFGGYSPSELAGRSFTELIYHEDLPYIMERFRQISSGDTGPSEFRILTKSGEIRWVRSNSRPIFEEGRFTGMQGTLTDITEKKLAETALQKLNDELEDRVQQRTADLQREVVERKQTEEKLKKSKIMLQSVFDGISDPLILLGRNLAVKMFNNAAAEYYKVKVSDAIGKPFYQAFKGKSGPCEGCNIPLSILKGETITFDRNGCMDPDRLEQVVVYFIKETDGEEGSAILRISDITAARSMERQLLQSEKLAAVGELAAGVAHEINNPINGVINYAQILIDEAGEGVDEHGIPERIMKEAERIAGIVKNLLSFARETGDVPSPAAIQDIVADTLELVEKHLNNDGIKLELDIPDDLPLVNVNSPKIQQVFMNLLSNARYALNTKYPDFHKDKVLCLAGKVQEVGGKIHLRITIHDTGVGIPENIIDKICDPFLTTKPSGEGTGLGLSISYGIVRDQGGRLSFESEHGEYTKAIVDLPAMAGG